MTTDLWRHQSRTPTGWPTCFASSASRPHPSGNPEPSNADKTVTKQIRSSADIIGIELLDHVIIGSNGNHFSFRQEGLFN